MRIRFFSRGLLPVCSALWFLAACEPPPPQPSSQGGAVQESETSVADFYHGNTVWIVVGFPPGNGYDTAARVLARHMEKHVPGVPEILVQNMPGAGGMVAANHVYGIAPNDGTIIGIFADTVPIAPLLNIEGARYNTGAIAWLGSLTETAAVILVRSDAPATTLEGARQKEILLGAGGAANNATTHPRLLNELIGTKFRVILGYPSISDVILAIERGELQGVSNRDWRTVERDQPGWIKNGFAVPLLLLTTKSFDGLPDVPLALDYAKNEEDLAIMRLAFGIHEYARAFSISAGVPPDRLAAMRAAFIATVADPDFVEEARVQFGKPLAVKTHEEIEEFVREAYALPDSVKERAARYIAAE